MDVSSAREQRAQPRDLQSRVQKYNVCSHTWSCIAQETEARRAEASSFCFRFGLGFSPKGEGLGHEQSSVLRDHTGLIPL